MRLVILRDKPTVSRFLHLVMILPLLLLTLLPFVIISISIIGFVNLSFYFIILIFIIFWISSFFLGVMMGPFNLTPPEYMVSTDAIFVSWAGLTVSIPLEAIQAIETRDAIDIFMPFRGWRGYQFACRFSKNIIVHFQVNNHTSFLRLSPSDVYSFIERVMAAKRLKLKSMASYGN